ncbi:DUF5410 family protein [Candidatus Tisiphia endosymbiont of Nemotelus uliginosus]|uniref:DUF5410 family protein n=1 Tax=Candidatus Tisiphia endosymbiont of Nemotelus uliginosus TaxID=3077926 RepID=UPI0035C8D540
MNNREEAMPTATNNKEPITQEIISRIACNKTTLDDLKTIQNYFVNHNYQPIREAFVKSLGENLSHTQLHQFNSKIMSNANSLSEPEDKKFMCRKTEMKIFKDLLVLEAEQRGMKVKFEKLEDIPQLSPIPLEILDHYSTLKEHFYKPRDVTEETQLNKHMVESISFLLISSLIEETEFYNTLSELQQASIQQLCVTNRNGAMSKQSPINSLIQQNIAKLAKPMQSREEMPYQRTGDELTTAIMKPLAAPLSQLIINKSLQDSNTNLNTEDMDTKQLSDVLSKKIPVETLLKKQNDIIVTLSKQLKDSKTIRSKITNFLFHDNEIKNIEEIVENVASAFSGSAQVTKKDQKTLSKSSKTKITAANIGPPTPFSNNLRTILHTNSTTQEATQTLHNHHFAINPDLSQGQTKALPPPIPPKPTGLMTTKPKHKGDTPGR